MKAVMDRCAEAKHALQLGRMHWRAYNTGAIAAQRWKAL
jgi:hypothetical protein